MAVTCRAMTCHGRALTWPFDDETSKAGHDLSWPYDGNTQGHVDGTAPCLSRLGNATAHQVARWGSNGKEEKRGRGRGRPCSPGPPWRGLRSASTCAAGLLSGAPLGAEATPKRRKEEGVAGGLVPRARHGEVFAPLRLAPRGYYQAPLSGLRQRPGGTGGLPDGRRAGLSARVPSTLRRAHGASLSSTGGQGLPASGGPPVPHTHSQRWND